jgi:1-hydroxycarotenoid 3,4-desaturase
MQVDTLQRNDQGSNPGFEPLRETKLSRTPRILVVGAGVGGLAAAARLAAAGCETTVLERSLAPGGKMRAVGVEDVEIDAGPTVLTMRFVFEDLFQACRRDFADGVRLTQLDRLARHFWRDGAQLDLYGDAERNAAAIREFAGAREAEGYRRFAGAAERAYLALRESFVTASRPSLPQLVARVAARRPADLFAMAPFETLWRALGRYFRDPRLRQLFARYATYSGASPFAAPATLMLIAHVEREGVWIVEGGMRRLAAALGELAGGCGAHIRYGCEVARIRVEGGRAAGVETAAGERIAADAVVFNGDVAALASGLLGEPARRSGARIAPPSLSALTWVAKAGVQGASWLHHNVLFGDDYREEFDAIFAQRRLPADPTIYVCAEDRAEGPPAGAQERLFVLVNAPPHREDGALSSQEIEICEQKVGAALNRLGSSLDWTRARMTGPQQFAAMFPASRGALYGPASHGWRASFTRGGARTRLPGLYLAGGSVHPGAGVPMAALSGRQAALAILADWPSTARSRPAATPGGISTPSATIGSSA